MSAYSDLMLSTAPVAYWRLGETAGTAAVDASGNGHNGTYTGGPTLGQPGLIVDTDTAVLFDGVDDHVAVPQDPALKLPGEMSAQAWIRPTALTNDADIVRQGIFNDGQYVVTITAAGAIRFGWWPDGTANQQLVSPSGLVAVGGTHHVVFTRDASLFIRGYLDGAEVVSGQGTAVGVDPATMQLGGSVGVRFFNGLIDEPAVHNYALTGPQVAELYDLGLNGPPPPPPSGSGTPRPARRYHRLRRGVTR